MGYEIVHLTQMIKAVLLDSMGSDLTVANTARVSFGKRKDELDAKDEKLIRYLAEHEHTSPFRHCVASFRCRAPIFVERQLKKHCVGLNWGLDQNEVSLRYVKAGDVWSPNVWREQSEDKKQGSGGVLPPHRQEEAAHAYGKAVEVALDTYEHLIELGVCREQARAVLPTGVLTEWVWTGTLQAWAHLVRLRTAPNAQAETREFAEQVETELLRLWPVAMAALGAVK
jgi:thymidylate synthase (FAD)